MDERTSLQPNNMATKTSAMHAAHALLTLAGAAIHLSTDPILTSYSWQSSQLHYPPGRAPNMLKATQSFATKCTMPAAGTKSLSVHSSLPDVLPVPRILADH